MMESFTAPISRNVTKTYGLRVLLISLPQRSVSFSPSLSRPAVNSSARFLTRIGSLLLLDLLQAAQQRVDLHLDLSQLPFNSLKLVRLHC